MKKKTVILISLLCIACLLIPVILQGCLMLPAMYADNPDLDQQTNDEIKKLILLSVKDLWLIGTDVDQQALYTTSDSLDVIQCDKDPSLRKSPICFIEKDFMRRLTKVDDNTYKVILKAHFPESYFCHITIVRTGEGFKISKFQLDI